MIDPTMLGWIEQWYEIGPVAGITTALVAPGGVTPASNEPLSATMW